MSDIEIDFYKKGKDVLLIFTGLGGSTKGYKNKYQTIAHQAMDDNNLSVVVAATPSDTWASLLECFQKVMDFIDKNISSDTSNIYAMGNSIGANIVLSFSYMFPKIKKVLAINPVLGLNFNWIDYNINNFKGENITIVVGDQDSSLKLVDLLPNNNKLQTIILPNTNHQFTQNLQQFIDLPKQHLLNNNIKNEDLSI